MIKGRINGKINQKVYISMLGENKEYYFPDAQFKTDSTGLFSCPIFLKRPLYLRVQIGSESLTTFMEPGDTLNISVIGQQSELIGNHFRNTKPNNYYSENKPKLEYFSGNCRF